MMALNHTTVKKSSTLFILFFFVVSFLKAQTGFDLYGVYFAPKTGFAKIDPSSGNLTILNEWSRQNIHAFGACTLDPKNKMYYQVVTDSLNMYLIKINLNTGVIVDTVFRQDSLGSGDGNTIWMSDEINDIFYNCKDDNIYFFYHKKNKDVDSSSELGTRLAKMDAMTGQVRLITILPGWWSGVQQYLDNTHQKIYSYNSISFDNSINVYDIQTGERSSIKLSRTYNYSHYINMLLNPSDNQLYGFEMDYSFFTSPKFIAKAKMIKINPNDGLVSDLSALFDFNGRSSLYFEPTNTKLYFIGDTSNPSYPNLFSFDIHTKERFFYPSTKHLWIGVFGINNTLPDATFTSEKFCQNIATEFYPASKIGSKEWNFGDPGSGNLNLSYETNPKHIYKNPGTYTVTMTSSDCFLSNKTTKQIVIVPFPKIDLGNDKIWCINKQQDEFLLKINAPGTSYFWQDLSADDTYTVKQPGIYWVNVSSGSCETRDSLIVREGNCPCDITVTPTLTHSTVSFLFDCYLSTYNALYLELYNERGELVMIQDIETSTTTINLETLAAGIYFYRIRDKSSVLRSGKIVFVK